MLKMTEIRTHTIIFLSAALLSACNSEPAPGPEIHDTKYRAVDATGQVQDASVAPGVCVLDTFTQLTWEVKTANPGLRSRFPKTIHFPDYSTEDLLKIFTMMGRKNRYEADEAAFEAARAWFDGQARDKGFGNARLARNLFENAVANHATRLVAITAPSDEELTTLVAADIPTVDGAGSAAPANGIVDGERP